MRMTLTENIREYQSKIFWVKGDSWGVSAHIANKGSGQSTLRKENSTLPEHQDEISQSKGVEAMLKKAGGIDKQEASLESTLSVGSEPGEKDLAKTSETQTPMEARPVGQVDKVSLDETDVLEKRQRCMS
jgi:hypothetical protein